MCDLFSMGETQEWDRNGETLSSCNSESAPKIHFVEAYLHPLSANKRLPGDSAGGGLTSKSLASRGVVECNDMGRIK